MRLLKRILEAVVVVAAVVVVVTAAAALTWVNLRVVFTVDLLAQEYAERVREDQIERARANHVLSRIEGHLKKLDTKHGRPIGPKK